jgi:hypothetical protein
MTLIESSAAFAQRAASKASSQDTEYQADNRASGTVGRGRR